MLYVHVWEALKTAFLAKKCFGKINLFFDKFKSAQTLLWVEEQTETNQNTK